MNARQSDSSFCFKLPRIHVGLRCNANEKSWLWKGPLPWTHNLFTLFHHGSLFLPYTRTRTEAFNAYAAAALKWQKFRDTIHLNNPPIFNCFTGNHCFTHLCFVHARTHAPLAKYWQNLFNTYLHSDLSPSVVNSHNVARKSHICSCTAMECIICV